MLSNGEFERPGVHGSEMASGSGDPVMAAGVDQLETVSSARRSSSTTENASELKQTNLTSWLK